MFLIRLFKKKNKKIKTKYENMAAEIQNKTKTQLITFSRLWRRS